MKGMLVSVYRDAGGYDCTNGGISSKHSAFILVGPGVPEIFTPSDCHPTIQLLVRPHFNDMIAVPLDANMGVGHTGYMFGGNFLYGCDSRLPFKHPIKIHDRKE